MEIQIGDIVEVQIKPTDAYGRPKLDVSFVGYYLGQENNNGQILHKVSPYSDDRPAHWLSESKIQVIHRK